MVGAGVGTLGLGRGRLEEDHGVTENRGDIMARTREARLRLVAVWVLAAGMILAGAGVGAAASASIDGQGSVSGVVTADGAPLSAAWVVLTPVTETGDWAGESAQSATDGAGRYSFEGLPAGNVKVHVRSPLVGDFVATYWPGVYAFGQAGVIPVTSQGFVADIDLPVGRSISGRVVAEDTGEPVEGAQLVARLADAAWSEPAGRFEPGSAPGTFEISGLPPVAIRLHVQVPQGSPFLGDGYWSDGSEAGRRIDSPGDVTGLVIRLPRGGEVSGTVRDGLGGPVTGASVWIENCQYACPSEATTDESGAYRIRGIPPSRHVIAHARTPGTIDQWFDRASDWIDATPFDLAAGEVRGGVDFVLVRGGVLTGHVIAGDTGQPLPWVPAYLESVVEPGRRYFADFVEVAPGGFRIGPVPPNSYRLVLLPNSSQSQYRPVRWLSATGISTSGIIRLGQVQDADVVVTLAATRSAPSECTVDRRWNGLFPGFLGQDPWPPARRCAPPAGAPGSGAERSA